ncbi:hypothetical protein GPECTOR_113g284 [Gonium pectorale]|uniref:Phosphatidylinositol N-acetylglucosaminyltransferase subunit C n=1 Tax=Gonium pectorale TaxID=33097 RepID=A0A150FZ42_GONPE|nr:hypothetical protein GPECTOR_113g284 [Gonium pectorale]|eukprot:KXZ42872.1 hypothetical protein GPECTOR_113g284 [Gonium pectorale]
MAEAPAESTSPGPGDGVGSGDGAEGGPSPAKWEKVLWKRQPFPDNYTDDTFLQHLVVNAELPPRRYWPLVVASAAVTQQACCCVAAGLVPLHLHAGRLGAGQVLAAAGGLLAAGYAACAVLGGQLLGGSVARGIRQCVLLVGGVWGLSPLLRSLAGTVSTDSVVALAVAGLLLHLGLHDYGFVNVLTDRMSGALSLGSGVMAAVLLAGRMRREADVFAVVLLSLELFLLSPFARRHVARACPTAHLALTAAMVGGAAWLLALASPAAAAAFLAAVAALTFVAPAALVRAHRFKARISGPWDEAAPHFPRELLLLPRAGRGQGAVVVVEGEGAGEEG